MSSNNAKKPHQSGSGGIVDRRGISDEVKDLPIIEK